jgi:hypothetical protein
VTVTENTAKLERLTPGAVIIGLRPDGPVTVVAAAWHGTSCVTLTYRTASGEVGEQLIFRDDEGSLEIEGDVQPFSFEGDAFRRETLASRSPAAQGYGLSGSGLDENGSRPWNRAVRCRVSV